MQAFLPVFVASDEPISGNQRESTRFCHTYHFQPRVGEYPSQFQCSQATEATYEDVDVFVTLRSWEHIETLSAGEPACPSSKTRCPRLSRGQEERKEG